MDINYIKKEFKNWDKKSPINIGNNRIYKIIGCGKQAFKVLKFEPQAELNNKGGWSQTFWNFDDLTPGSTALEVIEKMQFMMSGQTTL